MSTAATTCRRCFNNDILQTCVKQAEWLIYPPHVGSNGVPTYHRANARVESKLAGGACITSLFRSNRAPIGFERLSLKQGTAVVDPF